MERERYEALMRKTDWYFNLDDPRSGSIVQYECLRKKIRCKRMKIDNRVERYDAYKIKKPLDLEKLRERLNEEDDYKKCKIIDENFLITNAIKI